MKKSVISLLLFIFVFSLSGCQPYKNISDDKALSLGSKLIEKYFKTEVYSSGIHIEDQDDKYALTLSNKGSGLLLKNIFSDKHKNYYFSNNLVTVTNENEEVVFEISMTEDDFLKNYAGELKLKINDDNIKSHTTTTKELSYSKGNSKYYVLEQTIIFKNDLKIIVSLLDENYDFYVSKMVVEIDKNEIKKVYFDGYLIKNNKNIYLRYFVYKI